MRILVYGAGVLGCNLARNLIRAGNSFVAIDSGYSNSKNTRDGLKRLGIDAESVKAVFLTHLDIDHAGGALDNPAKM